MNVYKERLSAFLAVGFVILSWLICYFWFLGITEGWGAPWDIAPVRPPMGHWQRTINDFFESGVGRFLPALIFLTLSLVFYLHTLIRTHELRATSFVFGLTNLLIVIFSMLITMPIRIYLIQIPAHLTPADWSYWGDFRREWPLIVMMLLMVIALFYLQPLLVRRMIQDEQNAEVIG